MYKVLLLNDDYTPMEFVVQVLESFFNKSREEATRIMLHVHRKGMGLCGVYTYDVAETKVAQVMAAARAAQHPLQCTMEKNRMDQVVGLLPPSQFHAYTDGASERRHRPLAGSITTPDGQELDRSKKVIGKNITTAEILAAVLALGKIPLRIGSTVFHRLAILAAASAPITWRPITVSSESPLGNWKLPWPSIDALYSIMCRAAQA